MRQGKSRSVIALAGWMSAAAISAAQTPSTPLEAATTSKVDAPATIVDETRPAAADSDAMLRQLTGSFESDASDEDPALRYNAAPIKVEGLEGTLYFELTRADSPAEPFRQGVFHIYRFKEELRLRVFDLTGNTGLKDTLVGLWAAPEALPTLTTDSLDPNLDLVLLPGKKAGSFRGATPHPFPTMRDGAVEVTSQISAEEGELTLSDRGIAADGSTAWGGGKPAVFRRSPASPVTATRTEGGLIILTLVKAPEENLRLVENGTVAVQYTGWLTDGTRFDTSRAAGRQPFSTRIPGGVIRGWNDGLAGIAKGERRRLYIPPDMGYGQRGFQRVIPPNSPLIFDIECMHVDNTMPAELAPAAPGMGGNPHQ